MSLNLCSGEDEGKVLNDMGEYSFLVNELITQPLAYICFGRKKVRALITLENIVIKCLEKIGLKDLYPPKSSLG